MYQTQVSFTEIRYANQELLNYISFKFVVRRPFSFDAVMIPLVAYEIGSPVLVYLRETHSSQYGDFEEPIQHMILDRSMYLAQERWNNRKTNYQES